MDRRSFLYVATTTSKALLVVITFEKNFKRIAGGLASTTLNHSFWTSARFKKNLDVCPAKYCWLFSNGIAAKILFRWTTIQWLNSSAILEWMSHGISTIYVQIPFLEQIFRESKLKVSYALRSMSSSYFIDDAGSALMTKSHSKHLSFFSKSQDLGNMPSNLFLFWCHHRLFGWEVICLSRKVQLSNYYCSCACTNWLMDYFRIRTLTRDKWVSSPEYSYSWIFKHQVAQLFVWLFFFVPSEINRGGLNKRNEQRDWPVFNWQQWWKEKIWSLSWQKRYISIITWQQVCS